MCARGSGNVRQALRQHAAASRPSLLCGLTIFLLTRRQMMFAGSCQIAHCLFSCSRRRSFILAPAWEEVSSFQWVYETLGLIYRSVREVECVWMFSQDQKQSACFGNTDFLRTPLDWWTPVKCIHGTDDLHIVMPTNLGRAKSSQRQWNDRTETEKCPLCCQEIASSNHEDETAIQDCGVKRENLAVLWVWGMTLTLSLSISGHWAIVGICELINAM